MTEATDNHHKVQVKYVYLSSLSCAFVSVNLLFIFFCVIFYFLICLMYYLT